MINIKTSRLVSSWFLIGFSPRIPGTLGAVAALPLCFVISTMGCLMSLAVITMTTLLAIYVSNVTERLQKIKDPQEIVIDEVVGMMLTLYAVPFTPGNVILGLLIFRTVDISKPQPIRFLENKLPGGLGVVFDDVLAGIISNLLIRFIIICWFTSRAMVDL